MENGKIDLIDLKTELDNTNCKGPLITKDLLPDGNSFDVPEFAALLKCIGFHLEKIENINVEHIKEPTTEERTLRVEITCNRSGKRATLSTVINACKCSSTEINLNSAPSNQDNVTASQSNVVPTISNPNTTLIKSMLERALKIINGTDINQNEDNCFEINKSLLKRPRSLDSLKSDGSCCSLKSLSKQWENLQNTSPPKDASSPLTDLCNTAQPVSTFYEKASKLSNILVAVQKLVDEAIEVAGNQNATFTKSNKKKRISNIKASPLPDKKLLTGSFINVSTAKTPNSSIKKRTSSKKADGTANAAKFRFVAPSTSKLAHFKAPSSETYTPPTKRAPVRKDTPRYGTSKDKIPKPTNLPTKGKTEAKSGVASASKLRAPSKINISNIGKK